MASPTVVAERGESGPGADTVLVAVGNPGHVEQLFWTAADLARRESGSVHVVRVVAKGRDSPFGVFDDETIGEEFTWGSRVVLDRTPEAGRHLDVDVSGRMVVDRSVSHGIVATAAAVEADAVIVGWSGERRRSDAILGTNVDALVERAPTTCTSSGSGRPPTASIASRPGRRRATRHPGGGGRPRHRGRERRTTEAPVRRRRWDGSGDCTRPHRDDDRVPGGGECSGRG
jgi:nucleotide-binding universal stress UspA family protein